MLQAELGEGSSAQSHSFQQHNENSSDYHQERGDLHSSNKSHASRQYTSEENGSQSRYQERGKPNFDSVLIVSNLPYSTTVQDLEREFQDACNITLNRDDRGRPSGVAQLCFRTRQQCDAALAACNNMTLNGRSLRGRIGPGQGSNDMQRSYENRQGRGRSDSGQNPYDGRSDSGNVYRNFDNRPDQARNTQRDYGNRHGNQNYNTNRRDYDDGRRTSGGSWRGGRGRGEARDFNRGRQDRFGSRRERSPGQGEPIRGYAASKGFRITSAVISGSGSPSSHSSSGSD